VRSRPSCEQKGRQGRKGRGSWRERARAATDTRSKQKGAACTHKQRQHGEHHVESVGPLVPKDKLLHAQAVVVIFAQPGERHAACDVPGDTRAGKTLVKAQHTKC
jgi:hypothetical protein